jgi:hypothetical protein
MTTTTTDPHTVVRPGVTWRDIVWLTWRQHRVPVALTALGVLAAIAMMAWVAIEVGDWPDPHRFHDGQVPDLAWGLAGAASGFGAVIAVFWAAPLLAREYEQGTHLVAWSQDLRPGRWLIGKTMLLTATAVAMAAVLGTAATAMVNQVDAKTDRYFINQFDPLLFDARPLVQAAYAAFGFALGLTFSALTRRTVLSMGLTLLVYGGVRLLVAAVLRPYYQSPVRVLSPTATHIYPTRPPDTLYVAYGFADAAGNEVPDPHPGCAGNLPNLADFDACVRSRAVNTYVDYQPADRLGAFQAIEFGLFMLLTAALVALALNRTRRTMGL